MDLHYAGGHDSASFEDDHWWIRSRFPLIDQAIEAACPIGSFSLLEVGCGTGVNLRYVKKRYAERLRRAVGSDPSIQESTKEGIVFVKEVPIEGSFDVVLLMDVLEHTSEPVKLLDLCRDRLAPQGRLLITVPAFQWLWTIYDEAIHHHKRYSMNQLRWEITQAHLFTVDAFFLFGTFFPAFVLQRLYTRWRPSNPRLFKPVPRWINAVLGACTALEMRTWMKFNHWAGSSLVAFVRPLSHELLS